LAVAVIVELHRQADNLMALSGQQRGCHGRINSARHCYYDAHANSQLRNSQRPTNTQLPTPKTPKVRSKLPKFPIPSSDVLGVLGVGSWKFIVELAVVALRSCHRLTSVRSLPTTAGSFAIRLSTCSCVLPAPSEKRIEFCVRCDGRFIARSTCDGSSVPDEHADPVETAKTPRSRAMSR